MADELRHKDIVAGKIYENEYEHINQHIANNQAANDMLYFNGTRWVRATVTTILALLGISQVSEVMLPLSIDLSGLALDEVLFTPYVACTLEGYRVLYTEASSADAGVALRVGRLEADSTFDDDYYDAVTSEINEVVGYSKEYTSGDLTQSAIAVGETVTVGCAGGKVGIGEIRIILHIKIA